MSIGPGAVPAEFVLLRAASLLADLTLTPGTNLSARVLELLGNGRGVINLAGVKLEAQLPGQVRAGDILRLRVSQSPDDRLTLQLLERARPAAESQSAQAAGLALSTPGAQAQAQAASALAPALATLGLPGGAQAEIYLDPEDSGETGTPEGPRVRSLLLRYDSELLGRMDVAVRIDDTSVYATVLAVPGPPLDAARRGSDVLRTGLREAAGRPALVTISGRAGLPVDVSV